MVDVYDRNAVPAAHSQRGTPSDADLILSSKHKVPSLLFHLNMPIKQPPQVAKAELVEVTMSICFVQNLLAWLALQMKQSLRPFWASLTQTMVSMRPQYGRMASGQHINLPMLTTKTW